MVQQDNKNLHMQISRSPNPLNESKTRSYLYESQNSTEDVYGLHSSLFKLINIFQTVRIAFISRLSLEDIV